MRDSKITVYRPRNPVVHARHRREVLLQITLPVVLAVVILLATAVASALLPPAQASDWADVSLIWLIIPLLLLALVAMALFGGLAYAIIKLIDLLPYVFFRLQGVLNSIHHGLAVGSEKVTEPIFRIKMYRAGTSAFFRQMRPSRENKR